MANIIEVNHLSKRFRGKKGKKDEPPTEGFLLDDISFSVPAGSIMGFVGGNGAGKTTTIKLLLNQLIKDAGDIRIFGLDHAKDEVAVKEQIGVVFAENRFNEFLTCRTVEDILSAAYRTWNRDLYLRYLDEFGLQDKQKEQIKKFSKGMKMKLALAAALAHEPKLLILDEPTGGLDPVVRGEVLDVFLDFIQDEEHSVFFSSHITSDIEKVADYVTFINDGQIIFSESKDLLFEDYHIFRCRRDRFAELKNSLACGQLIGARDGRFGSEALIKGDVGFPVDGESIVTDRASLEDIMTFYVKGVA
ncbi:MAG: ABC transporter ATP-binding protein [Clostridiales Family XIII bacterium]|jgi:ABC-2 type transport system ATP-binding protein|nr:ABC transporter ATP-binding protein [Clostridiales Family XIII bacterium]